MSTTVEIKNIAAIHDLEIDIPNDSGGVLVLKGRNAAGKSTAIEIIRSLLAGKGKLACRDGAAKGKAEGFGRRVSVSTKTTYSGESEVESLEGRFDFSDLVLPDGKESETRDKTRIKALLSLTGVKADVTLFYDLVGGKEAFEAIVPAEQMKTDDLVEMAGRVHRAIHAAAKKKESDAAYADGHYKTCKEIAGDVPPGLTVDLDALHAKSNKAAAELATLKERKENAEKNAQAVAEAQAKLEKIQAEYTGPDAADAQVALDVANDAKKKAHSLVNDLERKLHEAKLAMSTCETAVAQAEAKREAAAGHQRMVAQLTRQIEQGQGGEEVPDAFDLELAEKAVAKTKEAVEQAVANRDRAKKAQEAEAHKKTAKAAADAAESLREAARSVDAVLTTKLPPGPLKAEAGRLVLDTDRGEAVPFDECSQGEKYRVALPYGIQSVGEGGYLALIQDGWQDLDTEHRNEIAAMCRESKVWLITGEVADGDLRPEVYQEAT